MVKGGAEVTVPNFQELFRPVLQKLADSNDHQVRVLRAEIAEDFHLTEDDLKELLPSGKQSVFTNRVAWSLAYLKMAKLVESPARGCYHITEDGIEFLKQHPEPFKIAALKSIPAFKEFHQGKGKGGKPPVGHEPVEDETPEETIQRGFDILKSDLIEELLTILKSTTPAFFERIVVDVLVKMGYGGSVIDAGEAVGKSGDGGIDGVIKEDKLGLDIIYIQAKRWENTVHSPEIHKFAGALAGMKAKKGVFITTSSFSKGAMEFAQGLESKIVLMNGEQLAQLMIDNSVGVSPVACYEVKRIDSDYFDED
jgi:restriction system protein